MPSRVRIAVGAAALDPSDIVVDLGAQQTHGGYAFTANLEAGTLTDISTQIGYVHRSAEKLFEARDYRQIIMLANRHDWIAPQASEISVAQAIESASGITPSDHAAWTRIMLMEANRISAALHFLSFIDPVLATTRERFVEWQERTIGARVHPMFVRIGGLLAPLPDDDLHALVTLASEADVAVRNLDYSSLSGIGLLPKKIARDLGASGPIARATGITNDLRGREPDAYYAELRDFLPSVTDSDSSDAADRFQSFAREITSSARILDFAAAKVMEHAAEPVHAPLPKTFKVPVGTTYHWTENPQGIHGVLLASAGDRSPLRMKLRTPSFAHIQCLTHALEGSREDDLAAIIASFFIVPGDMDR